MLTSKQRAYLRALGNECEVILTVGKAGVGDNLTRQLTDALTARELVKGRVLPTVEETPREVAEELADEVNAEVVQVVGRNFLLYRRSEEKPRIQLP